MAGAPNTPPHPRSPKVRLRPMTDADSDAVVRWSQDREFCLANDWTLDLPPEKVRAWLEGILAELPERFLRLGIELDGRLVGYADLADIQDRVGRAEFGIALGERGVWGQGVGTAAGRAMLRHGFHTLGLTRVTAQVHAPNARSLSLMRRLGFRQEGVLRRHEVYRGGVVDVVQFGLLREEFEEVQ